MTSTRSGRLLLGCELAAILMLALCVVWVARGGTDPMATFAHGLGDPAVDVAAVTPDDDTDLTKFPQALLLSADATVKVTTLDGTAIALPLLKGINPIRVRRVWETGTDVGVSVYALY